MNTATIELTDIGPVEHLTIPIPNEGGVVVLRGTNGSGKSSTLRAVDRLATGKKTIELTSRDGTPRGEMSGCGITLRVARSITRTGELECESLDGRLSVAELVDPGLKGAEENDGRRIRALAQLAGVKPDVGMFQLLFDDSKTFAEVTKGKDLKTDDVLILADRIKRAIDEAARGAEGVANIEKAKAAACKESASGINLNVETDDGKLQAWLENAIRHETTLTAKLTAATTRNAEILAAQQKIAESRGDVESAESIKVSLEMSRCSMVSAQNNVSGQKVLIKEMMDRMNADLKELESTSRLAEEKWIGLTRQLANAEQFEVTISDLKMTISAGELPVPDAASLSSAAEAVSKCRASIESGILARRANEQLDKSKTHAALELAALTKAESLRNAAKRVDEILSEQIASLGVALQVKAGRLVTRTRRGETLFADLSEGERWKLSLDIAIEAVGDGGLLSIPQEAYESLDPTNRKLIANHVCGKGVVILTAESTDGPLRAEIDTASL
jgi:hypothetical protein